MAGLSFAELLRQHRLSSGLTQAELAERAGLSWRGISDLERGLKQHPRPSTVRLLVRGLDLREAEAAALLRAAQSHRVPGQSVELAYERHHRPLHSLPLQLTSFVGRESQISDLVALLRKNRLLTLTGAGGVGKSRLALVVATQMRDEFPAGVVQVTLAGVDDPELVPGVVAAALGVREVAGRAILDTLVRAIDQRRMLLVLDNCEHLVASCASLADGLLHGCPEVRVLATSRRTLGLPAEVGWSVPPLTVPEATTTEPMDGLGRYEAVSLFIERARAIAPSFAMTPGNARVVGDLCRQLDGLPLAIELAAGRVKVLSPQQIAARLDDRFRLLRASGHQVVQRQQTLRATMDWSHELLGEPARVLLRRLSVFAGGFSLDAVEEVCAGTGLPQTLMSVDVIDVLSELVDHSLVVAEQSPDGEARYRLLETIRLYAAGKLADAGETRALQARHAAWCLALARSVARSTFPDAADSARLELEHDNLRSALRSCLENDQENTGLCLGAALGNWWFVRGHYAEGSAWLTTLLQLPRNQGPSSERSVALAWLGNYATLQARYEAAEAQIAESLALAERVGDRMTFGLALQLQGSLAMYRGDLITARQRFEQALALHRKLDDGRRQVVNLTQLARLDVFEGDLAGAAARAREGLTLARSFDDPVLFLSARCLQILGRVSALQGDEPAARRFFTQALAFARGAANAEIIGHVLLEQAWLDLRRGEAIDAHSRVVEGLTVAYSVGESWKYVELLQALAGVTVTDDPERAVRLAGAAFGILESLQLARVITSGAVDQALLDKWLASARRTLGASSFRDVWMEGQALSLDDAVRYGLETPAPGGRATLTGPSNGRLTRREHEVAILVAQGLTNIQIAETLVFTEATAAKHIEHVLDKLGFASRAQIAAWVGAAQPEILDSSRT